MKRWLTWAILILSVAVVIGTTVAINLSFGPDTPHNFDGHLNQQRRFNVQCVRGRVRIAWKSAAKSDARAGVIYHYPDWMGTTIATLPMGNADMNWIIFELWLPRMIATGVLILTLLSVITLRGPELERRVFQWLSMRISRRGEKGRKR